MASLERDRVPPARLIASREVPLVDRVEEMKLLKEAVDRTVQSEGGIVFLHGEAGIGKTRLARELRAYAHLKGMQVLYGRCPSLFRTDGIPPYVLWREVIRDYLENSNLEQLYRVIGFYPAEVAKVAPEISQKLKAIPQSFQISPEQEQNRLFEAVSQFITNIAREAPLLVVLDDLQWTDLSSLLLLHYLARGMQKTPLLLLGSYRSTDVDAKHPLTPILAELKRECLPQSVSLKRMSREDTSEMIRQILEQDDIPTEFCQRVYEKTRGNPFYTSEVIESLKEEETVYREDNKWKVKEVSAIEFPESVKSVVKARIGRLDDESQKVLMMASLVGNDFTLETLQGVVRLEEDKLRKIGDELLKTGLLKHRVIHGEDVCSFADIIVRDVVCEEIGMFERRKLHRVVAMALEKAYAQRVDEHFGELAAHFLEGGEKDKALDYFLKAGEKAQKICANNESASYFQSALKLLEEKEGELREKGRVLEKLGDVERLVGEFDQSVKCYTDALSLLKQLGEKESEARLYRKMSISLGEMGEMERSKKCLSDALKILETMPENTELVWVDDALAAHAWFAGDMREAISRAEMALDLAEKLKDFEGVARSYHLLALVHGTTGDWKKCIEYYEKALKIALDKGFTDIALWCYNNIAVNLPAEESEKALEYLRKGLELAKKAGDVSQQSWLSENLGWKSIGLGNTNEALSLGEESARLDKKSGHGIHLPLSLSLLARVYTVLGDWDKAQEYGQEALKVSQTPKDFQSVAFSYVPLGVLAFDRGEYSDARGYFEKARETCVKAGARALALWFSSWIIRTHVELGNFAEAESLLKSMQEFALETENRELIAYADALKATLLRAEKKWGNSLTLFEESIQEFDALNARRWNIYEFSKFVLYEYARTYLERDHEGDRERAHDLLSQAREAFERMGAKKDIEKTLRLMEGLQLASQVQTVEKTVSPASYVCEEVHGNIIVSARELKIGEPLELEIEVKNVRKEGTIILTNIVGAIPKGFVVARKPESCRVEDDCLNLKEKQLEPSRKEEVKLVLTPKLQGVFQIKPRIVYLDENGREKTCEPKPVSITVKELGLKGWLKGQA